MNVFYLEVVVGNLKVIKLLEEFVRKCLYLLWAQNYFYMLYMMCGKWCKVRCLFCEFCKNYFDYLFGIINELNLLVQEKKDMVVVWYLMGECLLFQGLYFECKVFYVSEVMNYYQFVVLLLFEEGDIEGVEEWYSIFLEIDFEYYISECVIEYILGKKVMVNLQWMKEVQCNK